MAIGAWRNGSRMVECPVHTPSGMCFQMADITLSTSGNMIGRLANGADSIVTAGTAVRCSGKDRANMA